MTPEQLEGNKLIFDFDDNAYWMDVEGGKIRIVHGGVFTDTTLKYHYSWDWLMPVVEKIEKEGHEISISSQMEYIHDDTETYWHQDCCISSDNQEIVNTTGRSKINSVYAAVVQFIQWYNTQTKQP